MRKRSVYEVVCVCGATLESERRIVTCAKCGRTLELHWDGRAPEQGKADAK